MDYFAYKNGRLFAEAVEVEQIAAQVGTPAYIYSKATFQDHLQRIRQAYSELDTTICYSVKACGNINILKFMAEAGTGFDIVSGDPTCKPKIRDFWFSILYQNIFKLNISVYKASFMYCFKPI